MFFSVAFYQHWNTITYAGIRVSIIVQSRWPTEAQYHNNGEQHNILYHNFVNRELCVVLRCTHLSRILMYYYIIGVENEVRIKTYSGARMKYHTTRRDVFGRCRLVVKRLCAIIVHNIVTVGMWYVVCGMCVLIFWNVGWNGNSKLHILLLICLVLIMIFFYNW